jgi:hypothetical protein
MFRGTDSHAKPPYLSSVIPAPQGLAITGPETSIGFEEKQESEAGQRDEAPPSPRHRLHGQNSRVPPTQTNTETLQRVFLLYDERFFFGGLGPSDKLGVTWGLLPLCHGEPAGRQACRTIRTHPFVPRQARDDIAQGDVLGNLRAIRSARNRGFAPTQNSNLQFILYNNIYAETECIAGTRTRYDE